MSARATSRRAVFVLLVALGACDREAGERRWIALDRSSAVPLLGEGAERAPRFALDDGRPVESFRDDGVRWLRVALERESLHETRRPGLWKTSPPIRGLGAVDLRLEGGGRSFHAATLDDVDENVDVPPWSFWLNHDLLYVRLDPDVELPEDLELSVKVERHDLDSAAATVSGRRFSGRGFSVWPGETVTFELDVPERSALRFATCAESALAGGSALDVTLRVQLDGAPLLEERATVGTDGWAAWHELALPARGLRGARLTFAVEGPFAYTSFLAPVIGPVEIGSYGKRPWSSAPDIIIFLADTFRADNLAAYGGRPGLTPALDAFAQESVRFERAWSVGTFTLPAHASMFSGLFPRQATADGLARPLPAQVETIAERLARAGYRTGAVTESGFVSFRFGLHQGFEWFDEQPGSLDSTLERARSFLAADDGRPVVLFVQTYRVHAPFEPGEHAEREIEELLGARLELDYDDAYKRWTSKRDAADVPGELRAAEALRALYLATVRDLDRGFARFLADLRELGLSDSATLVFTSDHGEAFLEHEHMFHKGRVFEELVRIPLLIRGPGLEPRSVPYAASLIDFAPTLAAIAGLPDDPSWPGESWLALERDRPVFAFECASGEQSSTVALIEGERKLIALEKGTSPRTIEPWRAFDLAGDPLERSDRLAGGEAWPEELHRRLAPLVETLLLPAVSPETVELDAAKRAELEALGYLGEK